MKKEKIKYSIYICPENLSLNPDWKKGFIGEKLKEINYLKNIWGLPHFTMIKFSDFGNLNLNNIILENKMKCDIQNIYETINDVSEIIVKNEIIDFSKAKIIKTEKLYIMIFDDLLIFNKIKEKLNFLGYSIKPNEYHITIGEINIIDTNPFFEELKTELNFSIVNEKITKNLFQYFDNLKWNLSLIKLTKIPAEVIYQIQIRS